MLKFTDGNRKLNMLAAYLGYRKNSVLVFDIPAGFSCRKADICKTYANKETGLMTHVGRIKCYASHQEAYLKNLRNLRWSNYNALLSCGNNVNEIMRMIVRNLPIQTKIVRIHSSGDFYSPAYFKAWCIVAALYPEVKFFGYTKELNYVLAAKSDNFHLVYSYGSKDDSKFESMDNKPAACYIQEFKNQYDTLNIPVICGKGGEHEDFGYIMSDLSFIIRLH